MQMADFTACAGPVSPTAGLGVTPDPVFPGDTVVVLNQSLGEVDASAIWVTLGSDPDGQVVAGDKNLSSSTPASRQFLVPRDILTNEAYYAHVAVESDEYPYGGSSTPDQIDTALIAVDRSPEVSFTLSPASPITGDEITVRAIAEGNPFNPTGGEAIQWHITPPAGGQLVPYDDFGSPITIDLSESGDWEIDLTVYYEHDGYSAIDHQKIGISSVFANFNYTPLEPFNTEAITLTSTSSFAAGATPSYAWEVTSTDVPPNPNYTGCPSGPTAAICTIPADSLEPGVYSFKLVATNTDNSDESDVVHSGIVVENGDIQLDFTWASSPDIGEDFAFNIEGVPGELTSATWNFGGAACSGDGYTNPSTCTPNFTDCKAEGYNYASSGNKTVSLTVNIDGTNFGPVTHSVTVNSTGSCTDNPPPTCTYSISPGSSTHAAAGGGGTISVSTQSGCAWTASRNQSWVTITSGSNGNGSGNVNYSVAANTGDARAATITAAGKTHTLNQAAAPCTFALGAYEVSIGASGGPGSVQVTTMSNCNWTAASHSGWITLSSSTTGTGTGVVHFVADPNPYPAQRIGSVVIAGNTLSVVQGPNIPTNFSMSKSNPEIGENVTFTVDGDLEPVSWNFGESNCYGDSAYIDCKTKPSGYCQSIEWSYPTSGDNNVTLVTSTGDMTKTITVQNRGECCIADDKPEAAFKMTPDPALTGETVTFMDTSSETKSQAAKTEINAVNFTWDPISPEIGDPVSFEITGANGTIKPATWEFSEVGCGGLEATYTCSGLYTDCTASTFTYASAGEKTVKLTAVVNGVPQGTVTRSLTVLSSGSCSGSGGCSYAINPSFAQYSKEGGNGSIAITTQAGCSWTASSDQVWASVISGASGAGSGAISYSVSENTGAYRTATIRAGGKNHAVSQAAGGSASCTYTISSTSAFFTEDGGAGSFVVSTQPGCAWTAMSNQSWTTITTGSSGTGTGTVAYSVGVNADVARTAIITAAGNSHVVNQADGTAGSGNTDPTYWSWTITKSGSAVTTSNEQDFSYVFTHSGLYEIELVAGNCKGESNEVQYLQVDRPPIQVPDDYLVPAAIHAPGLNNTLWKSDLRLFNPGDEQVEANIEYLPEGINNNGTVLHGTTITLNAKGTWVHPDIVDRFPVLIDDAAKGSLKITFEDELGGQPFVAPIIMSRTYNEAPEGTFGQFVPAVPVIPAENDEIYLTGLVENLYYRTNIGLANMGPEDAWVRITLFNKDGIAIGDPIERSVPGYSTIQVVKAAVQAGIQTAANIYSARIDTYDNEVSAYASLVDNMTGDPVLFTAYLLDDDIAYVPGLAHLPGVNDSSWRSDMTFFNPTGVPLDVLVEYVQAGGSSEAPWMEFPAMSNLSSYYFNDIVGYLLGQSAESKGYMVVSGIDGSLVPQIAARTYSEDSTSGTFGQSLKVFCSKDLVEVGQSAFIAGVSNSSDPETGFRTNLGLLNIEAEKWSEVSITLYNEDGEIAAEIESMYLEEAEFAQPNLFRILGIEDVDMTGSVEVKVLANGPVAIYASQIDNQTQDPILIPAQIVALE